MSDVTLSMTIFCIQSVVECADETGDWRSEAQVPAPRLCLEGIKPAWPPLMLAGC